MFLFTALTLAALYTEKQELKIKLIIKDAEQPEYFLNNLNYRLLYF
jgi:hypothetical protein